VVEKESKLTKKEIKKIARRESQNYMKKKISDEEATF